MNDEQLKTDELCVGEKITDELCVVEKIEWTNIYPQKKIVSLLFHIV